MNSTIKVALAICVAVSATATWAQAQTASTGKRDYRYCEVLPVSKQGGKWSLQAWNTTGYNLRTANGRDSCPEAKWNKLDFNAIAKEMNATCAVANGPRYWMMDAVKESGGSASKQTKVFGGMTFALDATISPEPAGCDFGGDPYKVHAIKRTTVWHYDAGKPIYELVSDKGDVFVMQSYSRAIDPNLKMSDLAGLGSVLKLPAGWSYKTETLTKPLDLVAPGIAFVASDNLNNAYQRRVKSK